MKMYKNVLKNTDVGLNAIINNNNSLKLLEQIFVFKITGGKGVLGNMLYKIKNIKFIKKMKKRIKSLSYKIYLGINEFLGFYKRYLIKLFIIKIVNLLTSVFIGLLFILCMIICFYLVNTTGIDSNDSINVIYSSKNNNPDIDIIKEQFNKFMDLFRNKNFDKQWLSPKYIYNTIDCQKDLYNKNSNLNYTNLNILKKVQELHLLSANNEILDLKDEISLLKLNLLNKDIEILDERKSIASYIDTLDITTIKEIKHKYSHSI